MEGRIVTYNDEISISHPFESDFQGAVNAEELYGLLSKITKDEVDLTVQDTELLVSSGRMKAGLKFETTITLPLKDIPKKMQVLPDSKEFSEFLSFAMRTCSNDTSQPKLTCVSIGEDGVIIGSDGYRLAYCQGQELPIKHFLLPASNAAEVVKIMPSHVVLEKGWVHFKNKKGTVISCRRLDDEYLPQDQVESVLKMSSVGKVEFPEKISEMIDRVYQFAKRDSFLDEVISVTIEKEKLILKSKSATTNSWIEEKAAVKCERDVSFVITPSLFQQIVRITRTAVLDKSMQKAKFKGEGWQYVIMLRNDSVAK
jgi:DNA polymerase III sliding clamp (beta) subunit (PCNA family)